MNINNNCSLFRSNNIVRVKTKEVLCDESSFTYACVVNKHLSA